MSSDTLPFKLISREKHLCKSTTFVDVDYDKLLRKKCDVIKNTPALLDLCGDIDGEVRSKNVLLRSTQYVAIAADLQSGSDLQHIQRAIDLRRRPILFVAEVALTYMSPEAVSRVLGWAATFAQGLSSSLKLYAMLTGDS